MRKLEEKIRADLAVNPLLGPEDEQFRHKIALLLQAESKHVDNNQSRTAPDINFLKNVIHQQATTSERKASEVELGLKTKK
ncbi:MAG: hypothetical protein EZS28_044221, partial [Streblomastix strix]